MHPLFKILLVAAVLAIVVVVFQSQRQDENQSGWAQYGAAVTQGLTLEALESARDQTRGTSAEPWVAYQLAVKLYESGSRANLDRSKQLTQDTLGQFPAHPSVPWLRRLLAVTDSYAGVPDKA